MEHDEPWDAVIVGGGFFGASLALLLAERLKRVLLVEREDQLLRRASYHNQARVHAGYHYPRSLMTAVRSRINFPRFREDFAECIVSDFTSCYAVARVLSKVTAGQFRIFMQRAGASLAPAPAAVQRLFNPDLIEAVFTVQEVAFDADRLREILLRRLEAAGVAIAPHTTIERVTPSAVGWELSGSENRWSARWVFNCTYSHLNQLRQTASMPLIPLKYELTEMALVQPPEPLVGLAVTVMCGPFFSLMPFPARGLWTLSHVRYTPHRYWTEKTAIAPQVLPQPTHGPLMIRDAARYLPAMGRCEQRDSLWEIKTILPQHETDDGRPILFHHDPHWPGFVTVMGGKLDNVYDLAPELDKLGLIVSRSAVR